MKVAIIQAPPVFFNLTESINKFEIMIKEAANNGADLCVFPETWLPGYPLWIDSAPEAAVWNNKAGKALYTALFKNSLSLESPEFERIKQIVYETGTITVLGINEIIKGTLYNTMLFINGEDGTYKIHRKLVPTYTERLIWGRGDGSTLNYIESKYGNISGLVCWEHWMPLARAVTHSFDEVVHIAQWPSVRELHQIASRNYAFEGNCFVIASGTVVRKKDVIDGFKSSNAFDEDGLKMLETISDNMDDYLYDGNSTVIAPDASFVTDPVRKSTDIVYAVLNLDKKYGEHLYLDSDGHYSRPDVFTLTVNTEEQKNVVFK